MKPKKPTRHFTGACLGAALALLAPSLFGRNQAALDKDLKAFQASNALFSKGVAAFERNETDKAVAALEECLRKLPRHAFARYYLANILYIQKDFRQALAQMESSLADYDGMIDLWAKADRLKLENMDSMLSSLQSAAYSSGSCRDARSAELVERYVTDTSFQIQDAAERRREAQVRMKGHYAYFCGNVLFQLQRYQDARVRYEEALRIDPGHANAYNNLAALFYLFKMYPEAIEVLDKADANGLEDLLNLKLKEAAYLAAGRSAAGILSEEFPADPQGGPAVVRFSLAVRQAGSTLPPLYENAYLVFDPDSRDAILIDPGTADPRISGFAAEHGLKVRAVLNTHGHPDHTGGNRHFAALFRAPVLVPEDDADFYEARPDRLLRDGETIAFGGLRVEVFATPGHSPGSLCFRAGQCLFSGDTLFKGFIGKPAAESERDVTKRRKEMIERIRDRLLGLPGETRVFPGHGKSTSIADERANNPF
ncbi:MAG: MBL fold metallo-hydrolase, partial [Candidatus Aminicenantes bacterium]|nr:MBL fold metallo-hydrolase [Candidatus Aminicenantes bacterium]